MMKKAWKYEHGKWEEIPNPLYRNVGQTHGEDEDDTEPDPQGQGYGAPAPLRDRNGVKVEVYARLMNGGYPYLVLATISGKRETVFVLNFQTLLEVLSKISAAFDTGG